MIFCSRPRGRARRWRDTERPGKSATLLNYCGIGKDLIEYTVDRSPYKQGRFLPGSHIPIYHPDRIRETKPDYVVILPWNLKDEIMDQLQFIREWGGRFVVPIPKWRSIEPEEQEVSDESRSVLRRSGNEAPGLLRRCSEAHGARLDRGPILWHVMKYYAHFGHKDFILCLGYKGNCIKDYFLDYDESVSNDFVCSQGGKKIEFMSATSTTGRSRSSRRERFHHRRASEAVEPYLKGEEMFLANYSDGLSDVPLPADDRDFHQSSAIASLLLVQPTASLDIVNWRSDGIGPRNSSLDAHRHLDQRRFLRDAEGDLSVYQAGRRIGSTNRFSGSLSKSVAGLPVQRLLAVHGYFQGQATLDELNQGAAPWRVWNKFAARSRTARKRCRPTNDSFNLEERANRPLEILCLGAIPTILKLAVAAPFSGWQNNIPIADFTG